MDGLALQPDLPPKGRATVLPTRSVPDWGRRHQGCLVLALSCLRPQHPPLFKGGGRFLLVHSVWEMLLEQRGGCWISLRLYFRKWQNFCDKQYVIRIWHMRMLSSSVTPIKIWFKNNVILLFDLLIPFDVSLLTLVFGSWFQTNILARFLPVLHIAGKHWCTIQSSRKCIRLIGYDCALRNIVWLELLPLSFNHLYACIRKAKSSRLCLDGWHCLLHGSSVW